MNQPVLNQNAPLILYHGRGRPKMTDLVHESEPGIAASLAAGSLITIKEIREIFGLGRTAPYGTLHGRRGLRARLIIIVALLILVAAIAFAALARSGTVRISAANNPATTVNPHSLSTKVTAKDGEKGRTRGSHSAATQPPAITEAEAERVLATYWRQNDIANKLRSDALLATIEAGSSYQMDTGTYRMEQATDPANNDYSPFKAEDAVYYIPREPSSVYPHWFVVRVRYANLASPWHATGAGYVLFTQAAKGGALMFYGLTARLSLAPPPGGMFELGIPGYYSHSQTLTSATVIYVDQFATYVPRGPASPRVVADASGVAG